MDTSKFMMVRKNMFTRSGEFAFSLYNRLTCKRWTFMCVRKYRHVRWIWLKVGKETFIYLGTIGSNDRYKLTPGSKLPMSASEHDVFIKIWTRLRENVLLPQHTEIYMSCKLCGKELTDPKSIEAGIGPCCAKKIAGKERWFARMK